MVRTFLRSKIQHAVVKSADINYEGILMVDSNLIEAAGMHAFEQAQVVDIENGASLETYLIAGESGSGVIQPNGAIAHLLHTGDHIIIMNYIQVPEPQPEEWQPTIVFVNEQNHIQEIK
jgi:aspartate 1-decarboxylase